MGTNKLSILERFVAPTSKFFKSIRNIGLALTTVGGTIVASPGNLPTVIVTVASYLTLAGIVMAAVAQATVEND